MINPLLNLEKNMIPKKLQELAEVGYTSAEVSGWLAELDLKQEDFERYLSELNEEREREDEVFLNEVVDWRPIEEGLYIVHNSSYTLLENEKTKEIVRIKCKFKIESVKDGVMYTIEQKWNEAFFKSIYLNFYYMLKTYDEVKKEVVLAKDLFEILPISKKVKWYGEMVNNPPYQNFNPCNCTPKRVNSYNDSVKYREIII